MKKLIFKLSVGITPLALIGLGSFGLALHGAKPNNFKPVNQADEMANGQSKLLEKARRWRNSNFTSLSVDGSNAGALVLTGTKSISRIDLYGNVLWTFDPSNSDLTNKVGFYDSNNRLTPFSGSTDFNVSDLSSKTVVEATQDQEDPNVFYLLLIPDAAVAQEQKTKDQVFENYYMADPTPVAPVAGGETGAQGGEAGGAGAPAAAAGAAAVPGVGGPAARSASSVTRLVEDGDTGMAGMTPGSATQNMVIGYEDPTNMIPKPKMLLDSSEDYQTINANKSYSSINAQKNLQGVIVKVNENLFNAENPYAIENMAFITPKDMVDNYPSTWKQGSSNGKMSNVTKFYQHDNPMAQDNLSFRAKYFPARLQTQINTPLVDSSFSPYEHPEWYEGDQFVMPWMQYITNLGGLYAKDGMVYLFGGNGTWVNNESALSIGVFRTRFESRTADAPGKVKTVGYPYGVLLSAISSDAARNQSPSLAGLGQDPGYHFVPRLAVGGVSSPKGANGNIFLGSAITWGTNGGNILDTKWDSPTVMRNAPTTFVTVNNMGTVVSTGTTTGNQANTNGMPMPTGDGNEAVPARWSNSYDYNSTRFAALISKPAGGNTKQVESLFTTALKLDTLNSLPDQFTQQNNVFFSYAMLDGRQWSLGTHKDSSWLTTNMLNNFTANTQAQLGTTSENANPRNVLNALTTAKGFDRRDIGNVVYTFSNNTNNYTYYYQVGSTITTWPEVGVNYKTSANINFYGLTRTDFGSVTQVPSQDNNQSASKLNGAYLSSTGDSAGWYNGSIYVKQANFTPSSQGYTWQDFKGLTTTASNAVISNWSKAGYSIRPDDDTVFSVSKIPFDKQIDAAINVRSLDSYYVQLQGDTSVNSVARLSPESTALALNNTRITNPLTNRDDVIGQGAFVSRNDIPSSFFENKINDLVTEQDGVEVLDPKFINSIYRYTPPQNNPDIKLRLLVIDRSRATNDFIKLLPQVKVDGQFVAVPQANSVFVSDQEFTGFNALPGYVLPVAISIPIIIIALALALGLGVGIPMSQNRKMLKQGFAISNKKVDILTTAVGSVFKQIINRTSVTNIKKTPQMLQANKKAGPAKPASASSPAAKKPASPAKPSAPGSKPAAPAKPKAPAAPTKKVE
ncbi:adhesin P1 [Mycoplasma tullyi]|uniref:Adhesin P1 n=1 Tax=Mycoplasma tullyi TaxID=1612150 RepID=A0A7D7YIE7_9MOLU|nr:adhesin P1 [Mycoplasma tullyi]QMT98680.1 adhesin P1 [Mycoplasma tullyi]